MAEARSAAAKHESDLEDLSGAYNALEAHSFQLEAQVRELRAKAGSGGVAAGVVAVPCQAQELSWHSKAHAYVLLLNILLRALCGQTMLPMLIIE